MTRIPSHTKESRMTSLLTIGGRGMRAAVLATGLALVLSLAASQSASADFGIDTFSAKAVNADGSLDTRAGAHPYASQFDFALKTVPSSYDPNQPIPDGGVLRDVVVDLPKGFVGNPQAVPYCEPIQLAKLGCSPASQIGTISVWSTTTYGPFPVDTIGLFNLRPAAGYVADFGFYNLGVTFHLRSKLLSDGYTIRTTLTQSSQGVRFLRAKTTLWGDPASAVHDVQRGPNYKCPFDSDDPICLDPNNIGLTNAGFTSPDGIPHRPLTTNPSDCSTAPVAKISVRSWEHPDVWSTATAPQPTPTGCESLVFEPTIDSVFDTLRPDSPTGQTLHLDVPQVGTVVGLGTPPLKSAKVTLPEGVTMNPSAADGLTGCSDAQIGIGTDNAVGCPDSSKLGDVTVTTPLLDQQLSGPIYLGAPVAGKPYRIFLVAENARYGISIRLEGLLHPDPRTGRITVVFDDNPELPFSRLDFRLTGGPRAPLATGLDCGRGETTSELTPWGGSLATPSSSVTISADGKGASCPAPGFAPSLKAGSSSSVAGGDGSFTLGVSRRQGDRYINDLGATLPTGLLGRIASVAQCAEAAAAAGSCGAGSQIGTTTVDSGSGPMPFSLGGKVFLTGPYKGAPFGLSVVVPALAGPFDLGTVVVRAALFIDPISAQVRVVSDPLPSILEGIPVRLQRVRIDIDKSGFMINPTSCAPKVIAAAISSDAGTSAGAENRFQVGDCGSLALKPKLGLTISGKGQTTDGKHPAVSAALTQPAGGQSNLKKVRVALPLSLALDPDNSDSDAMCSFAEGSKPEPQCPASSIVGKATATTPILAQPLSGPVYFVKNERKDPKSGRSIKTTPKLVIPLVGENGLKLTLTGISDVVDDQLVTTFNDIPDAPVSSFKMDINGGKKGILVISSADICKATQIADQQVNGQNGKTADADISIQTPSCPTKILSMKVAAKTVALKIGGLGAGKVTVTGRGIKKTTKTIARSTVATVTATRTGKTKPGAFKVKFTKAKVAAS
jgi:hypothetical protein